MTEKTNTALVAAVPKVLAGAKKMKLTEILIVGRGPDGFYAAASGSGDRALELANTFRRKLASGNW